jgi:glycosyltransferase involved in cell wall biosynthesis
MIDDGSTDNTIDIVRSFKDRRINYKRIPHSGRSKALNIGLREASFDWIVIADSDDIMVPQKLERFSEFIGDDESIIVSSYAYFFVNKKIVFNIIYPVAQNNIKRMLALHSFNCAVLYNKYHILNNSDGYNERLTCAEDYDLWLRIMSNSKFIIIPEFLTLINFRRSSYSRKDIVRTNKVIYGIQTEVYENDLASFGVCNRSKQIELKGWREFFYGDKIKARKYFLKLNFLLFLKPKVIIAILVTAINENYLIEFKNFILKYRLKYYLNYFKLSAKLARNLLSKYYTANSSR